MTDGVKVNELTVEELYSPVFSLDQKNFWKIETAIEERDRYKRALEYCVGVMEQASELYRHENDINIFDSAYEVALGALDNEKQESRK